MTWRLKGPCWTSFLSLSTFFCVTHLACGSKVTKALQHWTSRHRGHSEGCNFMSKTSNSMDVGGSTWINHQGFQGSAWNFKTRNAPIQHFDDRWNLPEICWLIWITKQRWKEWPHQVPKYYGHFRINDKFIHYTLGIETHSKRAQKSVHTKTSYEFSG